MSKKTAEKHYIFVENRSVSPEAFKNIINTERGLTDKQILETVEYVKMGDPKIPVENRVMLNELYRKFVITSKVKLLIAIWPDSICCCFGCSSSNFRPDDQLLINAYRESHHTRFVMRTNNSRLRDDVCMK